jgi:hypothetical protein
MTDHLLQDKMIKKAALAVKKVLAAKQVKVQIEMGDHQVPKNNFLK